MVVDHSWGGGIAYHTHASMKPRYFVITPIKNIWTSKLLTVGAVYASNCTKKKIMK